METARAEAGYRNTSTDHFQYCHCSIRASLRIWGDTSDSVHDADGWYWRGHFLHCSWTDRIWGVEKISAYIIPCCIKYKGTVSGSSFLYSKKKGSLAKQLNFSYKAKLPFYFFNSQLHQPDEDKIYLTAIAYICQDFYRIFLSNTTFALLIRYTYYRFPVSSDPSVHMAYCV